MLVSEAVTDKHDSDSHPDFDPIGQPFSPEEYFGHTHAKCSGTEN
jgi:hypothetical protein